MKRDYTKGLILDAANFGYLFVLLAVAIFNPDLDSRQNLDAMAWQYAFVCLGCFALGTVLTLALNALKIKTLGRFVFQPEHEKAAAAGQRWFTTFWGVQLSVTFVITCFVAAFATNFSMRELFSEHGFRGAVNIFSSLADPNFSILPVGIMAILETIFIAFLATVIAVPFAFFLSFLCAKNIMSKHPIGFMVYALLRTALNVTRSIEPLIWAIIFSVWVGIGPFAGMLALMLHSIASLAKQYSEIIECVNEGPIEGILSTGARTIQVVWFAVVPQIVLPYISFTIYRWDINVRMATIIGLVGGGGIGTMLIQYQGKGAWHEVGTLALLIVIVVWLMDTASAYLREAIK